MIDPWVRDVLRQQARAAWEDAKRLQREAERLVAETRDARRFSQLRRASRGAPHTSLGLDPGQWSGELAYLADRAIATSMPRADDGASGAGAGLVASVNHPTLVRLTELVGSRVGSVVGASDAGTALGLAISVQPDVAVVDSRLDLADGDEFVLTLPLYAPRTKALLLADDERAAAKAREIGIDVLPRQFAEGALLSWVAEAL